MIYILKKNFISITVFAKARKTVLSLCMLVILAGCNQELKTKLDEENANLILSALLSEGFNASKAVDVEGTYTITVAKDEFSSAIALMKQRGLPKQDFANVNDVFTAQGLVASPIQERAKYNYVVSQDIARTLTNLPEIISADVILSSPNKEKNRFEEKDKLTASVAIVADPQLATSTLQVRIKELVAYAVQDISYTDVSVMVSYVAPKSFEVNLTSFAGMTIHPASIFVIKSILAIIAVLLVALGTTLFLFFKARGDNGDVEEVDTSKSEQATEEGEEAEVEA